MTATSTTTTEVYCEAELNYAAGDGPIPVRVPIHDGRAAHDTVTFDAAGFCRLEHRSAVEDWRDASHVQTVHGPEVERLARAFTGCDQVLVYPPIVRSPQAAREVSDYAPIEFVHSDFTDDYRPMLEDPQRPYAPFLAPLLEQAGLTRQAIIDAERVLLLQLWRNTGARWPDCPLALCDARTVPRAQIYPFTVPEYGGRHLAFETFAVKPPAVPEANHWYTFPGMSADEVLAFRTYDSACSADDRPFWTPHSAFRDANVAADAPARESVEMRALCLFGR